VDGPAAAVLTGEGKFFSNGLDLDWMGQNPDRAGEVVNGLQALYARVLAFPRAVIAAINGHAFAGGGMLALACDQRVMREDRGFFCLPEVDIRIPFSDGMAALVQAKLTPSVAHQVMVTGRRYGGAEAAGAGIVDLAAAEEEVAPQAIGLAGSLADKDPGVVSQIKTTMNGAERSTSEDLEIRSRFPWLPRVRIGRSRYPSLLPRRRARPIPTRTSRGRGPS
jgi:enoyl-CoA hydratase/carnithine racemase